MLPKGQLSHWFASAIMFMSCSMQLTWPGLVGRPFGFVGSVPG